MTAPVQAAIKAAIAEGRAAHLHPGDLFSYVDNRGVLRTERWGEQPTATYPNLPWWRRVLRALTPPRFRKPLKPVWNDPVSRAMRLHQDALEAIELLAGCGRRRR